MNKEELQKEIAKTKEHLLNMEKMLKEQDKYERWKPDVYTKYYSINGVGEILKFSGYHPKYGAKRYAFGNCFKTREEAETVLERHKVKQQLEDIARRLNKGNEIDWRDDAQFKYSIFYNYELNIVDFRMDYKSKLEGMTYSLDKNFLRIALQEIGSNKLIKYLKGE